MLSFVCNFPGEVKNLNKTIFFGRVGGYGERFAGLRQDGSGMLGLAGLITLNVIPDTGLWDPGYDNRDQWA